MKKFWDNLSKPVLFGISGLVILLVAIWLLRKRILPAKAVEVAEGAVSKVTTASL